MEVGKLFILNDDDSLRVQVDDRNAVPVDELDDVLIKQAMATEPTTFCGNRINFPSKRQRP